MSTRNISIFLILIWMFQPPEADTKSSQDDVIVVEAEKEIVCDKSRLVCTATGSPQATHKGRILKGETLILRYQKEQGRSRMTDLEAVGQVHLTSEQGNQISGDHAIYHAAGEKITFTGETNKVTSRDGDVLTSLGPLTYTATKSPFFTASKNVLFREKKTGRVIKAEEMKGWIQSRSPAAKEHHFDTVQLKKLNAWGGVIIVTDEIQTQSDEALYHVAQGKITLTGHVISSQKGHIAIGERAVWHTKTNRIEMLPKKASKTQGHPDRKKVHVVIDSSPSSPHQKQK